MADLENLIAQISVGKGTSLGKVVTKKKTWKSFRAMFDRSKVLVDTTCTFAQYKALDVDGQGKKKLAAGNWMPALFKDGRRKGPNQLCRTMVVFDLDYVSLSQLDNIRLGFAPICKYAWFMHTTRSHCPEKPRVRLIVPVDRGMTLEECNALTRLLACELADEPDEGIEIPDIVSMKSNQVMYLPSISRDQDYWTDENDGQLLHVDKFLAQHPYWDDHALLPYKESEKTRGAIDPNKKMEDPREKQGYIGAFCRTYDVEEAIAEFLPDVYSPGEDNGTDTRYTYLLGTGSNGAVVYDNGLFLYSNHGSDPIEGAANAWDLVRVHLFGHLDADAPANTQIGNLPSSKKMMEFAKADASVSAELHSHMAAEMDAEFDDDDEFEDAEDDADDTPAETPKKADPSVADLLGGDDDDEEENEGTGDIADEFDDDDEDPEPEEKPKKEKTDLSWTANLRRKANGEIESVVHNAALICANDPRIKRAVAYNEFTQNPVAVDRIRTKSQKLPSKVVTRSEKRHGRPWTDGDDISIRLLCSAPATLGGWEVDFPRSTIEEAVVAAGAQNPIHPVKDFIKDMWETWKANGSPTGFMDQLAVRYMGCPDTEFHRQSSEKFCLGAVARIFEPGCKFDQMVVLQGAQGSRKSTFWEVYFGGFFGEMSKQLDKPDRMIESMQGMWGLEMGEMAAAKKAEATDLKEFLAKKVDRHRLAYAKRSGLYARQCVFTGTANEDDYLSDPTGSRRFWIWHVKHSRFDPIDTEHLEKNLWRVWGEAYQAYLDMRAAQPHGELWLDLEGREAIEEAEKIAEGSRKQTATEAIAEVIEEWLDRPIGRDEMEVQAHNLIDQEFDDEDDGSTRFVRNMVTAKECFSALRMEPVLSPYRNADVRTYGKALKLVSGWTEMSKCRRHGQNAVWFYRAEDGPEWIEAAALEPDTDDLLA